MKRKTGESAKRRLDVRKGLSYLCTILLVIAGADAGAQQQSIDKKQQSKQIQRMFHAKVNRHDVEGVLDDPAVANQLTYEQTMPDSNELNVDSRELSIDNLQRPRFVPVPVSSDGMQFVPGHGYVAGSAGGIEKGLSYLLTSLKSQPIGDQSPREIQGTPEIDPNADSPAPFQPLDHLGNEIGSNSDPLQRQVNAAGLSSPLSRPPEAISPPQLTKRLGPIERVSEHGKPFATSGPDRNSATCDSDVSLSTIHDSTILQQLERKGCGKEAVTHRNVLSSRSKK